MMTQHDDHVWLTVHGKAWAIRGIKRFRDGDADCTRFFLWRDYAPDLEFCTFTVIKPDWSPGNYWSGYCDAARAVIDAQL